MLRNSTTSKSLVSVLLEKMIAPSWVHYALLKLPFDQLRCGSLTLTFGERSHRFEGTEAGPHAELIIKQPFRAYWLLKTQGELGFVQAYYESAVETTSLYHLLKLAHLNQDCLDGLLANRIGNLVQLWQHRKRHNSLQNSKQNISYHYDLGNDFYRLWLDPSMTYSSALYEGQALSLQEAQARKNQRILDELQLEGGESLLEIGCGWGGFMQAALENGTQIKGLTLSAEQREYALQRLASFDAARYEIALQDYRLEAQQYDHVVSIEMFEAVGKEYWQSYFETLQKTLKQTGKAVLQIITIADDKADSYQSSVDFIQAYIFPGGLLPSVQQLHQLADEYGFKVENCLDFGQDYGTTCQLWKQSFNQHSEQLKQMGYDRAFQRIWNYYLDYCTVGFESGHISVNQLTLVHK
ncbi:cyclopropane-fatty-acyl-phospholipid synthase [Thiosulfatimonas sediminis]|uniref:Cyclopropane-fatty-acyl-phospholipid synthase n=1 Tax=Thiosulfatimonas sediminis TaxID=2675054 RepID=A0A6F8PXU7_9GAMM|nr:cyclopropane-fatty-acyl-phospholipid synthase family protein [Thiosulfatimonas sediminis]BBP46790.1 cyclopropane-fatty-acyl-phospholipid synthase [Thiosulfatimonas sediminis]